MSFLQRAFGIGLGFVFIGIAVAKIATRNDLPGCDAQPTRDALSDIFKSTDTKVTRYDAFRTTSAGKELVSCTAFLAMADDHKAELDYSITRAENGQFMVKTTDVRNK